MPEVPINLGDIPVEAGAANFTEDQPQTMMDTTSEVLKQSTPPVQAPESKSFDPWNTSLDDIEKPFKQIASDAGWTLEDIGEAKLYSGLANLPTDLVLDNMDVAREEYKKEPSFMEATSKAFQQDSIQHEIHVLANRQAHGEVLTPDLLFKMDQLAEQSNEIAKWMEDNKMGFVPEMIKDSASSLLPSMYRGLERGAPKAAAYGAVGTGIGLMTGPASPVAAPTIAGASFAAGMTIGVFESMQEEMTGKIYYDIMQEAKKQGQPVNIENAQTIAQIGGTVDAALELVEWGILARAPGASWLTKPVKNFMSKTLTRRVIGTFVGQAIGTTASETVTETLQDTVDMAALEYAKRMNNQEGASYKIADAAEMGKQVVKSLQDNARVMAPAGIFRAVLGGIGASMSKRPGKFVKLHDNPTSTSYSYAIYDVTDAAENMMAENPGRLEDLETFIKNTSGAIEFPDTMAKEAADIIAGTEFREGFSNREDLKAQIMAARPETMDEEKADKMVSMIELHANYRGEDLSEYTNRYIRGIVQGQETAGQYFSRRVDEETGKVELKPTEKPESQVQDWLFESYTSEEAESYFTRIREFIGSQRRLATKGRSSLAANQKTIMSIDFSTVCPFKEMGSPCIYCYVEQPRTWVKKLGHKLFGNSPKLEHQTINYTNEILEMPQELVDFFNSIGGLRVFSFGDYREQDMAKMQTVIDHAKQRGLKLKAITKQQPFIDKFGKDVQTDLSTDFDPDFAEKISSDRNVQMTLKSARSLISRAMTPSDAVAQKAANPNVRLRYVAMNRADAILAIMSPKYDVVTLYHGYTDPEKLMAIWRIQNPDLFKNLGEETVRALSEMFQSSKTKTYTDPDKSIMKLVHRVTGDPTITEEQFKQQALKKLCCQYNACGKCSVCCGFKKGEGLQILNQFLSGEVRASIEFDIDNRALIRAFKSAEVADFVHELGHLFRRTLLPEDLAVVEGIFKVKDGVWTEAQEEAFAKAFERYCAEGKAKTPQLQKIFEQLRRWMAHLYTSIVRSSIKITPELENVFDKMLGARLQGKPFKKTKTVYRIVNTKAKNPGQMFPMFMGAKEPTRIGSWIPAEISPGPMSQGHPGWHSGRLPMAQHLRTEHGKGHIRPGRVWVQAEIPAEQVTTQDQQEWGTLPPPNGYYEFRTNTSQVDPWYISGAIKITKVLNNADVRKILEEAGVPESEIQKEMQDEAVFKQFEPRVLYSTRNEVMLINTIFKNPQADADTVRSEKEALKGTLIRKIYLGEAEGAARFTTVKEINDTMEAGQWLVSDQYGAIHAQPILSKEDDAFVTYGNTEEHNVVVVFPPESVREKKDRHTKECYIDPKVKLEDVRVIVPYSNRMWTMGELNVAMHESNILYSTRQVAPMWFSQMKLTLQEKLPNTGTPEQFSKLIDTWVSKGMIKAEEVRWTDIKDWLKEQGEERVSKDDVIRYVSAHMLDIKEVFHTQTIAKYSDGVVEQGPITYGEQTWKITWPDGNFAGGFGSKELAEDWKTRKDDEVVFENTKYFREPLVTPGTKKGNYSELLVTIPKEVFGEFFPQNIHWNEDNVVIHVRFSEQVLPNGKRILFIEEVQSDWHEQGMHEGYQTPVTGLTPYEQAKVNVEEKRTAYRKIVQEGLRLWVENFVKAGGAISIDDAAYERAERLVERMPVDGVMKSLEGHPIYEEWSNARKEYVNASEEMRNTKQDVSKLPPPAPFQKTWHEFAMKRMLRYAAENGYDVIGWTTGETQVQRNIDAMDQVVDNFNWKRVSTGQTLIIFNYQSGEADSIVVDTNGIVTETDPGSVLDRGRGGHLSKIVGVDMASEILSNPDGNVKGKELVFGGKFLKVLYDEKIVQFINKYGKKWGVKAEEGTIRITPTKPQFQVGIGYENEWYIYDVEMGEKVGNAVGFATKEEAQAYKEYLERDIVGKDTQKIWKAELSQTLKDEVLYTGQVLYSRRARNEAPANTAGGAVRRQSVKSRVLDVTGQKKVGDMVSEHDALKGRLQGERVAAKEAFKAGQEEGWVKGATEVAAPAFKAGEKEGAKVTREKIETVNREKRWLRKQIAYLQGVSKIVSKKKLPSPQQEILQDMLQGVDLKKPTANTIFHLTKLRDWMQSHQTEVELSDETMEQLSRLDKVPIRDMTVDEVNGLVNSVRHFITLARQKQRIRAQGKRLARENAEKAAIEELKPVKVKPDKVLGDLNIKSKIVAGMRYLKRFVHHFDMMVEELSQKGPGGVLYDVFVRQIHQGEQDMMRYQRDAFNLVYGELDAFQKANGIKDIEKWLDETRIITLNNKHTGAPTKIRLSRNEILSIYRHSINEDNVRAMLQGGIGFKNKETPNQTFILNQTQLDQIIDSLTDAEVKFATGRIDELFDRQYELMAQVFYKKNGYKLEKVERYFPKDVMAVERGEKSVEAETLAERMKGQTVRVGVPKGMTKSRVDSKKPVYIKPFTDVIADSILKASRYIGLEIPLSNAGNLLYDSRQLRAEMSDRYGSVPKLGGVWEQIERGLQDIAGVNHSSEAHDVVGGWFRGNFATGQLGMNIFTVLRQLSGLPTFMKDVPIHHLLKAFFTTGLDYSETIKRIEEYSPMFYERVRGGYSRDIQDALRKLDKNNRMFGTTSFFRHPIQRMKGAVMKPTQMVDKVTVAMGMEGAKEYVLEMFKTGEWDQRVLDRLGITARDAQAMSPEERLQTAYRYADWVTTQTQPVSSKIYRSGVSRSGNFLRLMTMYTEQTNALMNMWSQAVNETSRTGNKTILLRTFMAMSINSAWQVFVSNIIRGLMLKDDYEPDWSKLLVDFLGDMVFGPFYFLPDLLRYIRGEGKYQHPLHAVAERVVRGATNIIKSFSTPNARKAEKQLSSGISMLASGAGSVMGIPLGPTWTLWQAVQKAVSKTE